MRLDELRRLISQEIRRLRLERGWTQQQVADRMGMARASYTMMETRQPPTHLGRLLQLCEIFDCTLAEFLAAIYRHQEDRDRHR